MSNLDLPDTWSPDFTNMMAGPRITRQTCRCRYKLKPSFSFLLTYVQVVVNIRRQRVTEEVAMRYFTGAIWITD